MRAATTVVFGPYRLETRIASGPSATVWRARDTGHGDRTVAVKVFAPNLSHDPRFVAAFRSDAARFDALREPHIVPIHSYGQINGHLYLDMRLVEGPTFAEMVARGPLDEYRSRTIVEQIDAATASMVRGGLGHRFIEPGDVVLTGTPGNGEFVQLVGLGIGRPPVGPHGTARSLTPWLADFDAQLAKPPRRRRPWLISAVIAVLIAAAAVLVVVVPRSPAPTGSAPSGVGAAAPQPAGPLATYADTSGDRPHALAESELDGRTVLVLAAADGSLRVWDPLTGAPVRPPIPGAHTAVDTTTIDGRPAIVSINNGTVVLNELATGSPIPPATPIAATGESLLRTEIDGVPAVVVAQDGGVRLYRLPSGAPAGPLLTEPTDPPSTVFVFTVVTIDGRPALVSIDSSHRVHARDLGTGAAIGVATPPQAGTTLAITTAVRDGRPVVLTGNADNTVRIWDVHTGQQVGQPLSGNTSTVSLLGTFRVGDRTVVVSSTALLAPEGSTEIRFWDLGTGAPVGAPLVEHRAGILWQSITAGGRSLLVARDRDKPVFTVWDAANLAGLGEK